MKYQEVHWVNLTLRTRKNKPLVEGFVGDNLSIRGWDEYRSFKPFIFNGWDNFIANMEEAIGDPFQYSFVLGNALYTLEWNIRMCYYLPDMECMAFHVKDTYNEVER